MRRKQARYDADAITLKAITEGDKYAVSGTKLFVPDAHLAHYMLVVAKTDDRAKPERGITVFIVPADSLGISLAPLQTMAHDKLFEVKFNRVKVPNENILEIWPITPVCQGRFFD